MTSTASLHERQGFPLPPKERFWQRYSPHHEFPVSLFSSAFLHTLVLSLLAFGGLLLALAGLNRGAERTEITVVQFAPGGIPDGADQGAPQGVPPAQTEQGEKEQSPDPMQQAKPLVKPTPVKEKPPDFGPILTDAQSGRPLDREPDPAERLRKVGEKALKMRAGPVAKKGPSGNGPGDRVGKLDPDIIPPQNRWVMTFSTSNGEDYRNQLADLGAILAFPSTGGQFQVIRDLKQRPVQTKVEGIEQFNQMRWWDDKPDSVRSLARALGLAEVPESFVAFFPVELEKKLRDLEQKKFGTPEKKIKLTYFKVSKGKAGRYEPVAESQDQK